MTPPALVANPSSSVLEVQSTVTVGNDAPSRRVCHAGQADPGGRGAFSSVITSPEVVAVGACGCRKPAPPGHMPCETPSARSRERCLGGQVCFGLACDDLRLVGLKLIFLVVTRAVSVLGLSRREAWREDAEILMLRHQLAVALRERPGAHSRLTWPDRAWLALLAGTLPAGRLAGLRLIVTPATILRWHRDIVRRRWRGCPAGGVPAGRRCAALCGRWCSGWRGRTSHGVPADPR